jgi:membrane-associated phospholipid phosphatase
MSAVPQTLLSPIRRGWATAALLLATFLALALVAAFGEQTLLRVDRPLQEAVVGAREGWLNDVMGWVTFLGTRYVIGGLLLVMTVWTLVTGRCRVALAVLLVAFALNPLFEWALKAGVGRIRPDLLPLLPGRGPSFPSGHVMASVGFYGMLPAFLSEAGTGSRAKIAAAVAGIAIILAIGFSRIYVGVHWFTDVIGGFLIGSVIVFVTYRALRGHRIDRCPVPRCLDQRSRVPSSLAR